MTASRLEYVFWDSAYRLDAWGSVGELAYPVFKLFLNLFKYKSYDRFKTIH